ncbi:unnamed protein product [Vitrella brassicaformis CCMP3155]|uniref:PIPK domain-containing protein n=3 Tax=Vitrella brassicaformis TaxID=1169539 RepID=A0A0G4E8F6_VITBC|nr:unnamed protein product [Vitrella brassicaformis CCMP3155]|eukprot:CEL92023.1 unnamed protein product [Vitrella brassicaformis CCMP3155]
MSCGLGSCRRVRGVVDDHPAADAPVPRRVDVETLQKVRKEMQDRFTPKEIQALYARFRRICPTGHMSKARFRETLGYLGMLDDPFLPDSMFEAFDQNNDGELDFFEFVTSLGIMIRGSEDEKLELSFRILNANSVRLHRAQQQRAAAEAAAGGPSHPPDGKELPHKDSRDDEKLVQGRCNGVLPALSARRSVSTPDVPSSGTQGGVSATSTTTAAGAGGGGGGGGVSRGGVVVIERGMDPNFITYDEFKAMVRCVDTTISSLVPGRPEVDLSDVNMQHLFMRLASPGEDGKLRMTLEDYKNAVKHSPEFLALLGVLPFGFSSSRAARSPNKRSGVGVSPGTPGVSGLLRDPTAQFGRDGMLAVSPRFSTDTPRESGRMRYIRHELLAIRDLLTKTVDNMVRFLDANAVLFRMDSGDRRPDSSLQTASVGASQMASPQPPAAHSAPPATPQTPQPQPVPQRHPPPQRRPTESVPFVSLYGEAGAGVGGGSDYNYTSSYPFSSSNGTSQPYGSSSDPKQSSSGGPGHSKGTYGSGGSLAASNGTLRSSLTFNTGWMRQAGLDQRLDQAIADYLRQALAPVGQQGHGGDDGHEAGEMAVSMGGATKPPRKPQWSCWPVCIARHPPLVVPPEALPHERPEADDRPPQQQEAPQQQPPAGPTPSPPVALPLLPAAQSSCPPSPSLTTSSPIPVLAPLFPPLSDTGDLDQPAVSAPRSPPPGTGSTRAPTTSPARPPETTALTPPEPVEGTGSQAEDYPSTFVVTSGLMTSLTTILGGSGSMQDGQKPPAAEEANNKLPVTTAAALPAPPGDTSGARVKDGERQEDTRKTGGRDGVVRAPGLKPQEVVVGMAATTAEPMRFPVKRERSDGEGEPGAERAPTKAKVEVPPLTPQAMTQVVKPTERLTMPPQRPAPTPLQPPEPSQDAGDAGRFSAPPGRMDPRYTQYMLRLQQKVLALLNMIDREPTVDESSSTEHPAYGIAGLDRGHSPSAVAVEGVMTDSGVVAVEPPANLPVVSKDTRISDTTSSLPASRLGSRRESLEREEGEPDTSTMRQVKVSFPDGRAGLPLDLNDIDDPSVRSPAVEAYVRGGPGSVTMPVDRAGTGWMGGTGGRASVMQNIPTGTRRDRRHRRRTQRQYRLLGPKKGLAIHFGHENWNLVLNMMLGIRQGVGSIENAPNRQIMSADFEMKEKLTLAPRLGHLLDTAAKSFTVTRFIDYAPFVFRKIRERFGVDADEYLRSVGPEQLMGNMVLGNLSSLSELSSEGKSGAFFYYTADGRFMIKTMTPAEARFFRSLLKDYYAYLRANPHTLLCKFYGLHGLRLTKKTFVSTKVVKLYFVVMGNFFNTPVEIQRRYDLKGSWVGRSTRPEKLGDPPDRTVALKDNDFRVRREQLNLGSERRAALVSQLTSDAHFLEDHHIIDYSLLLGIHDRDMTNPEELPLSDTPASRVQASHTPTRGMMAVAPFRSSPGSSTNIGASASGAGDAVYTPREGGGSSQPHGGGDDTDNEAILQGRPPGPRVPFHEEFCGGMLSSDEKQIYYLGIIDFLTLYDNRKILEYAVKSVRYDRKGISCVPPPQYAERFINFIADNVR